MDYRALVEHRKSVRAFTDKTVNKKEREMLRDYYKGQVRRLVPEIRTELQIFGTEAREALEGAAGYHQFLVGAPQYMVILSQEHTLAGLNAGYIMEDMILKLTDMGLDSCWMTFTDSSAVKAALNISSDLEVAAIAAFGYGQRTVKRIRLNIRSMSRVDTVAKRGYMEPKRHVSELVFLKNWGNRDGVMEHIGFYDDVFWEAFYAASQSPSYLNRQAYGFVLQDETVSLVARPDEYNVPIDTELSLGVVLHHFSSVAEQWCGKCDWRFGAEAAQIALPEGHRVVASCKL